MNQTRLFTASGRLWPLFFVVLLGVLPGCMGNGDRSKVQVVEEPYAFAAQDDYVYYPSYACYYSASRHQYSYREGNVWVARATPPGVPVVVLQASPSVKMEFHDPPAPHHAAVAKRYPHDWKPTVAHQERIPADGKPRPD